MLTNAAKHDLDEKSLVQEIQQLGLPKENTDALAKQYREYKDNLRAKFADDSYRVSKLLSTDWRVDQVLASSSYAQNSSNSRTFPSPIIHVNLSVDMRPELGQGVAADRVRGVAFEVSPEKLDVLIHELSQAQKLMENMVN